MDFKSYDCLVFHSKGLLSAHPADCSYAYDVLRIVSSSKCLPISCRPIGRLFEVKPQGIEIPGTPARLTLIVNMSARYIWGGSFVFSPSLNAGVGEVGVTMISACLKASSKSLFIRVLTCCAFL